MVFQIFSEELRLPGKMNALAERNYNFIGANEKGAKPRVSAP